MKTGLLSLSFRIASLVLFPAAALTLGGLSCNKPSADTGLLRSTDAGETWEQKTRINDKQGIAAKNFLTVVVSPFGSERILAGGIETGVWVSTNKGETWATTNLSAPTIRSLAFSAKTKGVAYAAGALAGTGKIYRSEDGGSVWKEVYSATHGDQRVDAVAVDWFDDRRVYAGSQDTTFLKSEDGGTTWQTVFRFPSRIIDIEIEPTQDARHIYVATESHGVWKTTDAGKSWTRLEANEAFSGAQQVFDVEVSPALPSMVYVASRYGLTRSRDEGDTWEDVPLLVKPGSVSELHIALDPFSILPVYVAIDSSFYVSRDLGETWDPQKVTTNRIRALTIDPNGSQDLFMAIQKVK